MNRVQYQLRWPPFSKSLIGLFVALVSFWFATVLFEPLRMAQPMFATSFDNVTNGRVWTLLTYGVWHSSFLEVLFIGFACWIFGADVQARYGTKTWWGVVFGSTLLGGVLLLAEGAIVQADAATLATGLDATTTAFVTLYCLMHWTNRINLFFVPMTGRTLWLIIIGISLAFGIASGLRAPIVLDLAGVIVGFAVGKRWLKISDLRTRFALWRARRHLKLVRTPEEHGYMNGARRNGAGKKGGPELLN